MVCIYSLHSVYTVYVVYIHNAIYSYRQCDSTQIVFVAQVISPDIEELGLLFVVASTLPEGYE